MKIFIPPNIEDAGSMFGGMFTTRNVCEAAIGIGIGALAYRLLYFLPVIPRISVSAVITILLVLLGLLGIGGKPVSVWLTDTLNYKKTRCVVTLRMPKSEETDKIRPKKFVISRKKKGGE